MAKIKYMLLLAVFITANVSAQSIKKMWKDAEKAQKNNLPETQLALYNKIEKKAMASKRYGDALQAQWLSVCAYQDISQDSVVSYLQKIDAKAQEVKSKNAVLYALYNVLLAGSYEKAFGYEENYKALILQYKENALSQADVLARTNSLSYTPFVKVGANGFTFQNDLLHAVGFTLNTFEPLYSYYKKVQNQKALCCIEVAMLKYKTENIYNNEILKGYLAQADSLLNIYQRLNEASSLAVVRYNILDKLSSTTNKDRVEFINYALSKWGKQEMVSNLRNELATLTQPEFSISLEKNVIMPNTTIKVMVNKWRNLNTLSLKVWRLKYNEGLTKSYISDNEIEKLKTLKEGEAVINFSKQLEPKTNYAILTDSIELNPLSKGVYLIEASVNNKNVKPAYSLLYVSGISYISQRLSNKEMRIVVVDAFSGEAIEGAKLSVKRTFYGSDKEETEQIYCKADGTTTLMLPERATLDIKPVYKDDVFVPYNTVYNDYFAGEERKDKEKVSIFTDRSIFRPGQTMYVSLLSYNLLKKPELSINAGKTLEVSLRDANNESVDHKEVTTDEYGSAHLSFILPTNRLTGLFSIRVAGERYFFRVENYKRPTFEVQLAKNSLHNAPTNMQSVKGKVLSYAGNNMPNMRVKAVMKLQEIDKTRFWGIEKATIESQTDTLYTNEKGEFVLNTPLSWNNKIRNEKHVYYLLNVETEVLSSSGESKESSITLPFGRNKTQISASINNIIERTKGINTTISCSNLAYEPINNHLKYCFDNDNRWKNISANTPINISTAHLKNGKHSIIFVCNEDTLTHHFISFGLKETAMPVKSSSFFYQSSNVVSEKNPIAYVKVGTSDDNQQVFYVLTHGSNVMKMGVKTLNNEVITEQFTINDVPEEGLEVAYVWLRNGQLYHHRAAISRDLPEKQLNLTWKTFRNKLTPGQKETWTLRITDAQNKAQRAQLLAVLYDKTLDAIYPHLFSFAPKVYPFSPRLTASSITNVPCFLSASALLENYGLYYFIPNSMLNTEDDNIMEYKVTRFYATRSVGEAVKMYKSTIQGSKMASTMIADEVTENKIEGNENNFLTTTKLANLEIKNSVIRGNFNETAFFYPNVESAGDGIASLSFTLPESVTTWKFMAFAHDKKLNYGFLNAEVVASKEVMVQPNTPRFLRKGDETVLSALVSNLSLENKNAVAKLELVHPETQKVLLSKKENCIIEKQDTKVVNFNVNTKELPELVIARFTITGKGFEDGEQHYISILSNLEKVINVRSFVLHQEGKETLDVSELFPKEGENKKLTIEYTQDPVWLLFSSLPSMSNMRANNALDVLTSYYANKLMGVLVNQVPNIENVLEVWRNSNKKTSVLNSALAQNEDLKLSSLIETPWVSKAKNETENAQNLLRNDFINEVEERANASLEKLKALQHNNGAFSWYPNMPANAYITSMVLEKMAILSSLGIGNQSFRSLLNTALIFAQEQMKEEVESIKKQLKEGKKAPVISETALRYLYAKTLLKDKKNIDWDENDAYLLTTLSNFGASLPILQKAKAAILLFKNKEQGAIYEHRASLLLQSVKEHTVNQPTMGRYFDFKKANNESVDMAVLTQISAIEALLEINPEDVKTIEEMKRWLLMSKQTLHNYSELAGIETAMVFAKDNRNNTFTLKPFSTQFVLDGKPFSTTHSTKVLGYVKETKEVNQINTFDVEKHSEGTSWGALYGSFEQPINKIKQAQNGFSIAKTLWVNGKEVSVKELKKGDRLTVKITFTADKRYDFVQITDEKAACLEPVNALSGYKNGAYCAITDAQTHFYFNYVSKGTHVIEIEYYVDKTGIYELAPCKVQCAYAPLFMARTNSEQVIVKP